MARHDHEAVEAFVTQVFRATGAPADVATDVATSLVEADLRGQHAQGVLRLEWILSKIENGEIEPAARPDVAKRAGATAQVAGNSAIGQHVGAEAVELGADLADSHGVGAVAIRDANDLGRVGEWAEIATTLGYVFVAAINAKGDRSVAPDGCEKRLLSTNPLAMGIPTFDALDFPIVLDMASSQVAYGQVMERRAADESLPPEWTSTASGDPVTDPAAFLDDDEGVLLPLGGRATGYKGFGLAILNELLAGLLSGGTVAGQPDLPPSGNDALFVTLDPLWFVERTEYEQQIRWFDDYLRSAPSETSLRFPGERGHYARQEYEADGIPLSQHTVATLVEIARTHEVTDSLPDSFAE